MLQCKVNDTYPARRDTRMDGVIVYISSVAASEACLDIHVMSYNKNCLIFLKIMNQCGNFSVAIILSLNLLCIHLAHL